MKIQATLLTLLSLASSALADTQLTEQDLFIDSDAFPISTYDSVVLAVGENLHLDGTTDSIVGYHVHPPLMNGMGPDYVAEVDYSAILRNNGSIDAQFDRDGKYMVQVVRASGSGARCTRPSRPGRSRPGASGASRRPRSRRR